MKWLVLLLGVLANTSASVLIKVAVDKIDMSGYAEQPWRLLGNLPLVTGVVLYGAAFVLYAIALTKLPLNIAHPILTCGAVALVAVSSFVVFRETFYWTTYTGLVLVMVGVCLIAQRG